MPNLQKSLMQRLYGHDVWEGFSAPTSLDAAQGWNGNHPSLARLVSTPGEKTVIDVGVWKGQSTITMANAMKKAGIDGCVLAIDTFLGSPEHWASDLNFFDRRHGRPDLFETFLSNVYNAGVSDYVIPLPQTSTTMSNLLSRMNIFASVIHVDAAHEYVDVLRDAQDYWKILSKGGYMIGDDYHFTWPGVVKAAGEFSALTGRPLSIEPPKWILQKEGD